MDPIFPPHEQTERPVTRRPISAAVLGLLSVSALAAIDAAVPADISFLAFYLVPVALVGWFGGEAVGVITALAGAAAWYLAATAFDNAPHPILSVWNASMKLGAFLFAALASSALRRARESMAALARTDPLTGTANRRAFLDALDREVRRSCRYQRPLTLAYFDVDNFKTVNDLYGHAEGDRLLRAAVSALRETIRGTDQLGRIGGDEFAILFPEAGLEEARAAIEKCRRVLSAAAARGGWPVTFSFGAVSGACPTDSPETLLRKADVLLLEAKRAGKDQVRQALIDAPSPPRPA